MESLGELESHAFLVCSIFLCNANVIIYKCGEILPMFEVDRRHQTNKIDVNV